WRGRWSRWPTVRGRQSRTSAWGTSCSPGGVAGRSVPLGCVGCIGRGGFVGVGSPRGRGGGLGGRPGARASPWIGGRGAGWDRGGGERDGGGGCAGMGSGAGSRGGAQRTKSRPRRGQSTHKRH